MQEGVNAVGYESILRASSQKDLSASEGDGERKGEREEEIEGRRGARGTMERTDGRCEAEEGLRREGRKEEGKPHYAQIAR